MTGMDRVDSMRRKYCVMSIVLERISHRDLSGFLT